MTNVICFAERKQNAIGRAPIIEKIIDGKKIECIDFEALPLAEQVALLDRNSQKKSR